MKNDVGAKNLSPRAASFKAPPLLQPKGEKFFAPTTGVRGGFKFGVLQGKLTGPEPDFLAPVPADELADWEGAKLQI